MTYKYNGININYEIYGYGNIPIVFLHGWGGSIESFSFICKDLDFNFRALFIDFPPFGKSDEPMVPLTIFDYANIVKDIITQNNFVKPFIVGHSFGGRVAIILASQNLARGLVLTASAGMRVRHGVKYYFKVYKHKLIKKLGLKSNGGSADYRALSEIMKKTFVNIVNTNLEKYAININVPCILFWGRTDKDTPYYMAKKLNKLIKNSEIILCEKAGHFCYLENYSQFVGVVNHLVVHCNKNII